MSMLTPPGMGGQYRITGDKYPRMRPPRRRGRLVLVVTASVVVIGVISWGTLQLVDVFTGGGDRASAAGTKADCATRANPSPSAAVAVPQPRAVTVNVLNATTRSGLAKRTADELRKRGFTIGEVGNAPKQWDKKVKGTGLLIGPDSARNTSLPVLATQLPTAQRSTDPARKGKAIDLVIGDGFRELAKKPDADRALAALTAPRPAATGAKESC